MVTEDEPSAFSRHVADRMAYGLARRRMERDRTGPNVSGRVSGLQLDALTQWAMVEMGGDHVIGEAVGKGVRDAAEKRSPRW